MDIRRPMIFFSKEGDRGSKGGDYQKGHEGGHEGPGTRPSGTGTNSGSTTIGGSKSGTVYPGPAPSTGGNKPG